MEQSIDVVDYVSSLLDTEKYKEALTVAVDEKYAKQFKDNCWDLIAIIIGKINNDTNTLKPSLYGTCEQFLSIIVQSAVPEEALLEFIEQIEVSKNDAQFSITLEPLQQLLLKLTSKRGRSLEWCLNAICTYIDAIPVPEYQLDGKERLLLECDENIRRITRVYSLLPPFYGPFIKEVVALDADNKPKQIITAFLITLLGKPLIYVDVDPEGNKNSEARHCTSILLNDICLLIRNPLKFLDYVQTCSNEVEKPKSKDNYDDDDEILPYQHKEKINMTTLSGLFYGIFSGHFEIPDTAFPLVYSPRYVSDIVLLCVVHLLNFTEYGPLSKGIFLCKEISKRYPGNISSNELNTMVHYNLCKNLMNIAIFSTFETLRKESVVLLRIHINKFDYKGRCLLIKYIMDKANHSGMIGYAITLFKNSLDEAFKEPKLPECFKDVQLYNMLKKICYLPHGAESDLVELADQIITSLNVLRYLAIKDKENVTHIRNYFDEIESNYLEPLRIGLNMSKAHYEIKLKDIEEAKKTPEERVNISINVGGNLLDKIPDKNKKEIIISALNAFHLIEGLVARLTFRCGRKVVMPIAYIQSNKSLRIIRNYCKGSINKEIPNDNIVSHTIEHDERQYEEDIKRRILAKALEFVPTSGWSIESLTQGSEAVGYPGITHGLFPNGGGDLVHHFNVTCNEQLVEHMKNWPKEELKEPNVPVKLIENAIVTRLLMIDPYKSTWPKAMAIQALPNNVPNSLATLLSLVDDICYHTGDRSVDFNWYIRRVGLAGIYKASELFYLTDKSQDSAATKNFVKARIRDAEFIQIAIKMNPIAVAPQTLSAAFVTAKNILGINSLK